MGAISEPPEVLGGMIGSALVGTFLGVFLAYGIVGPMGVRLKAVIDEDALFYHVIRDILVAHLHGNAAQVSVEIGRGSVPSEYQPSFPEMENAINTIPPDRRLITRLAEFRFRQGDEKHRQRAGEDAQQHGVGQLQIGAEGDDGGDQHPRQLRNVFRHEGDPGHLSQYGTGGAGNKRALF